MNKFVILLTCMVLASCINPLTRNKKVEEKILEKNLEAQTGGKVDINTDKETITIQTEEGETVVSGGENAQLPEGFPQELMTDDAKIVVSTNNPNGMSVAYITNEEPEVILNNFISKMESSGWTKGMELNTSQAKVVSFSQDKQMVSVTIGENNSKDKSAKTMVSVMLTLEQPEGE